ncbi:hypothetical protein ACFL56_02510 [Candidatus Margulisiibacteriota bacterium]
MKKILILVFFILTCTVHAGITYDPLHRYNVPSALGMGNAMSAHAKGTESPFYNPAGIVHAQETEVFFSHRNILDNNTYTVSSAFPNLIQIPFAVSLVHENSGLIDKTKISGGLPVDTGDTFSETRSILAFTSAVTLHEFDIGLNIKTISHTIDNDSASGISGDIGLLKQYRQPIFGIIHNSAYSLTISNILINKIRWSTNTEDNFNSDVTFGLKGSVFLGKSEIVLSFDNTFPTNTYEESETAYGIDAAIIKNLHLRIGSNSAIGATLGVGFETNNIRFDYAYLSHTEQSLISHIFGITLSLGNNQTTAVESTPEPTPVETEITEVEELTLPEEKTLIQ